ncbi:MAG: hypothetical protein LC437_00580 [Thiohalomonas sp.]|nr:hypothetical protein [Thiohalomonas sp.]
MKYVSKALAAAIVVGAVIIPIQASAFWDDGNSNTNWNGYGNNNAYGSGYNNWDNRFQGYGDQRYMNNTGYGAYRPYDYGPYARRVVVQPAPVPAEK